MWLPGGEYLKRHRDEWHTMSIKSGMCSDNRVKHGLEYRYSHVWSTASCSLGRLAFGLLPGLVPSVVRKETTKSGKLHPSAYLDGMRGLAAFAVFLCHLSYGTFDIAHVYGTGKSGENDRFWQLPIVRLFYSGPPHVAIFFVISGYVLSYKPLKLMRTKQHEALLATLSSSVFRRAIRLFLPCIVSTFIVACMAQMGLYSMTENFANSMHAIHEDRVKTASDPLSQLLDWGHNVFDFVNVFDWSLYAGSISYDRHLWTIPVEYRCSMALFLSHILVARMSPKLRLSTLCFLFWWCMRWNRWELTPFWAGAILAEMDLIKLATDVLDSTTDDVFTDSSTKRCSSVRRVSRKSIYLGVFIIGLYLASYPDADGHKAPGFVYLTKMIPDYFSEKHRFWPNIGAIMIVWSTGQLTSLKSIFETSPIQYLGKISFPLYVVHGPIIHTFGYLVMEKMLTITGYDNQHTTPFVLGFCISALATIAAVLWTADLFLRTVDVHCIAFARWLESKFLNS